MLSTQDRYRIIRAFRRRVAEKTGYVPFEHQAEWSLASEGFTLHKLPAQPFQPSQRVLIYEKQALPEDVILERREVRSHRCVVVSRLITARSNGPAHICADLAGYKGGKSFGMAKWASGYAPLRGERVQFIGLEYSTSEPEFDYLIEDLLSERGMNLKKEKLHNDPRGGRMILKIRDGCTFECKSWTNRENLKGKRISAYVYTECYQLPGLMVFTTLAQNLRELEGHAIFGTTADDPWVDVFHRYGHGVDPDFHCTCAVDARVNPFTFDQKARDRDDPTRGGLMTRERFAVAWEGKLGVFVGRVYPYQKGTLCFGPATHPILWKEASLDRLMRDTHESAVV